MKRACTAALIACFALLAGPAWAFDPAQQSGPFQVPDGDATATLSLRLPDDATEAERLSLVGAKLVLIGRSELIHAPSGERIHVTVDSSLRVHGSQLHQWIYELSAAEIRVQGRADAALGPFRFKRDQHFYPRWGEHFETAIELERSRDISGLVVNASGAPVEGAQVSATWKRRSIYGSGVKEICITDANGRFALEEMPVRPSFVSAQTEPWEMCRLYGKELRGALEDSRELRLVLRTDDAVRREILAKKALPKTRHHLKGVVTGLSKAELEECVVCFAPTARVRTQPLLASSALISQWRRKSVSPNAESGAFELTAVPWGPTTVWAEIGSQSIIRRSERAALDVNGDVPAVRLTIPSPGSIGGRVLNQEGRGLAGVEIALEQTSGSSILSTVKMTTDADGAFAHDRLPPGTYRASLNHDRYVLASDPPPGELTVVAGESRDGVVLTAITGGWIALKMIDWLGDPLPWEQANYSVLSHSMDFNARHHWPPKVIDGSVTLGPYRPGTYRVRRGFWSVNRHARIMAFQDVTVAAGQVSAATLDERTQGFDQVKTRCRGRVLIDGEPVLAATVTIRDEIGQLASCFTNVRGEFEMAVPKAGSLTLTARDRVGGSKAVTTEITLRTDQASTVELGLK